MRIFIYALLILLVWFQYALWVGKNGVLDYQDVRQDIVIQKEVNERLKARNSAMFAEIDDLREGLDAVEERARNQLGLIKEDETFYRILEDEL